ncbi:MAG: methyltransferase domain-containing protein [Proteobacteria bacterium]|nr:methyltransferase domain-containing protein [Pseudomonadota bacterium]
MKLSVNNKIGTLHSTVRWGHNGIYHTDCFGDQQINFYRDCFPEAVYDAVENSETGNRIDLEFNVDELIPFENKNDVVKIPPHQFNRFVRKDQPVHPFAGRFYPKGMLLGQPGIFKVNMTPFRMVDVCEDHLKVDLRHPMAGKTISLNLDIENIQNNHSERGGSCNDWRGNILDGIGMKTRYNGTPTDFFKEDTFKRLDESPDTRFYQMPRYVNHLDDTAIRTIRNQYEKILKPETKVLDLMSSWTSHLPEGRRFEKVTGLGLNEAELKRNERLTDYVVHDLNKNTDITLETNGYDAVICAASIEYLIHPFETFKEISRILKPDGIFAISFSNRWFSPKAIHIWKELHEFERVGFVLELFLQSGGFKNIQTYSMRGLERPSNDKYYGDHYHSDPVFMVWGQNK